LEPIALLQPVDHAARKRRQMAGYALHFRVLHRINDDIVSKPVDADLADFLGGSRRSSNDHHGSKHQSGKTLQYDHHPASRTVVARRWVNNYGFARAGIQPPHFSRKASISSV